MASRRHSRGQEANFASWSPSRAFLGHSWPSWEHGRWAIRRHSRRWLHVSRAWNHRCTCQLVQQPFKHCPKRISGDLVGEEERRMSSLVHIVYLRTGPMLLTKKQYRTWREIQDEYSDYMTSLGPWTASDLVEFLKEEYPLDFTQDESDRITRFFESDAETLTLFSKEEAG
jgi:hypothetical protein